MKISANAVFETALGLLGLYGSDGKISPAADEYRYNAVSCLNALIAELSGLHDAVSGQSIAPPRISSLSDFLECDELFGGAILPLGLAKLLAARFEPGLSAILKNEFNESLKLLKTRRKAKGEEIKEVYG